MKTCAPLICIGLLMMSASATLAQETEFRAPKESDGKLSWQFKEGQVIKMKQTQDMIMSTSAGAMNTEVSNDAVNEMTLTVKSVDENGVAVVENIIDRMVIKTEGPGMSMEIDTSSDKELDSMEESVASAIRPLVGAVISQKMSPNGKIFDVNVPKEMFSGMAGNPAGAMFNEETIKETTSKASLIFPETTPAVGDTWINNADMKMGPATVSTETTYEYLGVSDSSGSPYHVIRGKIAMSFPDGIQGMDVDISDEDSTFLFYFDGNAGRIAKAELDQNMTMGIDAGAQQIEQSIQQKMTITYSEK